MAMVAGAGDCDGHPASTGWPAAPLICRCRADDADDQRIWVAIRNTHKGPITFIEFATREEAEKAEVEVREALC